MRLSKSETSSLISFPIQSGAVGLNDHLADFARLSSNGSSAAPTREALAELIDLVADHRSDLVKTLLNVLSEAEGARAQTRELTDLVAACGVSEASSPCATAKAISAELDQLIKTSDRWTHPAQIVRRPNARALKMLCATRLERAVGAEREGLQEILPRLERAARLTEKAALRRVQDIAKAQK